MSDLGFIIIGDEMIDVRGLHDIVSSRQLDSLGFMLRLIEISNNDSMIDIVKKIDELYEKIEGGDVEGMAEMMRTSTKRRERFDKKEE